MTYLRIHAQRLWTAFYLALVLTILSAIAIPLFGNELAELTSGGETLIAEICEDGTCP